MALACAAHATLADSRTAAWLASQHAADKGEERGEER